MNILKKNAFNFLKIFNKMWRRKTSRGSVESGYLTNEHNKKVKEKS